LANGHSNGSNGGVSIERILGLSPAVARLFPALRQTANPIRADFLAQINAAGYSGRHV
jgi:hypothetical protein